MRHYKKGRKLGTDASHTKAIKKNLVVNLIKNDRVKTTLERAKEIRGDVDRVITWAKRGDVHSRRLAIAKLGDKDLVAELFSKVAQGMFEGRPGGYTRILRLGTRRGDGASIVIMELVQEPVAKKAKAEDEKPAAKKTPKAAAKKKAKVEESEVDEDASEPVIASDADAKQSSPEDATPEAEEVAEVEAPEEAPEDTPEAEPEEAPADEA
jgi:large subunit ribosomal protein L17